MNLDMKNYIFILGIILIVASCTNNNYQTMTTESDMSENQGSNINDTTPRVTGIGGIFFKSENPNELSQWYGDNLGLTIDDYGSPFEFRNAHSPYDINYLRWSPFEKNTDYFNPSEKGFMINYRVYDIENLIINLKTNGITVLDEIEEYEYGKFVHILDIEGNKLELWEPIDSFLTELSGSTNKTNDETIAKVTGIGGVFFKCEDTEKIKKWYSENLGISVNEYGSSFEFRNYFNKDEINYLQWSPFSKNTDYFLPSEKELMINYRVQNIDKLVEELKSEGVVIVDEIEEYSYGKFIHIMDPEGNKIELWEPIDSVFTEMGGETTK